jgi:RNA polymerase sigma factor for flagellar operon FliA
MSKVDDDRFAAQYAPLVRNIAQRLRSELGLASDLEDLVAFGFQGLLEARARFDADRGVRFDSFAYYRIRGAVLDGVRAMAYLPRRAHARVKAAEAADAVAEEVGERRAAHPVAVDAAGELSEAVARIATGWVLATVGHGDVDETTPEVTAQRRSESARLRAAVARLPERERKLIEGHYFDERRFDHVAEELGVSKSWGSRLHGKALSRLRDALASDEE